MNARGRALTLLVLVAGLGACQDVAPLVLPTGTEPPSPAASLSPSLEPVGPRPAVATASPGPRVSEPPPVVQLGTPRPSAGPDASPTAAALTPPPEAALPGEDAPGDAASDDAPGVPSEPGPRASEPCDVAFKSLDVDRDRAISRFEWTTREAPWSSYDTLTAEFTRRDRNGDGRLVFDEWCPAFVQPSLPPCGVWFQLVDTDNDGEVSLGEAEHADREAPSGPNVARLRALDTDRDGKATLLQACGLFPSVAPPGDTCDERFRAESRGTEVIGNPAIVVDFDRNGDGLVDRQEFEAFCLPVFYPCTYEFRLWAGLDQQLSEEEAKRRGWSADLFSRRDQDGDGTVDEGEFCDPTER